MASGLGAIAANGSHDRGVLPAGLGRAGPATSAPVGLPTTTAPTPTTLATSTTTPTTVPGTCPGSPPAAQLPAALFSGNGPFAVDPYYKQGQFTPDQVSGQLASAIRPALTATLSSPGLVMAIRQVFYDPAASARVDVRAYQYGCIGAADDQFTAEATAQLGTINGTPITAESEQAAGWASQGASELGTFLQASENTVGDYWLAVFTTTASPVDGAFNAAVMRAETDYLGRWQSDPAAVAPPGPAPPAQTVLPTEGSDTPVCPAASPAAPSLLARFQPPTPAGFVPFTDPAAGGAIDSSVLASADPLPALVKANLAAQGFEGGYLWFWRKASTGEVEAVQVLLFSCDQGAAVASEAEVDPTVTQFTVTDPIPGAAGFEARSRDPEGHYPQWVTYADGRMSMTVDFFSESTDTSTLEILAEQAYQHADPVVRALPDGG